ncbi:MAG: dehydrogenase [Sedimentibacter sp.]|jgi:predicted molibdopterin-dependent oxidoreductase YjgC|nr:dehydrogenase [Sedimentibacter sp.]
MNRIPNHPILEDEKPEKEVQIFVDNKPIIALEGEMIAAALIANGIFINRYTTHKHKPRGIYCAIGRCTDCIMTVDGVPNVRTCVTKVREGMKIITQQGTGVWSEEVQND